MSRCNKNLLTTVIKIPPCIAIFYLRCGKHSILTSIGPSSRQSINIVCPSFHLGLNHAHRLLKAVNNPKLLPLCRGFDNGEPQKSKFVPRTVTRPAISVLLKKTLKSILHPSKEKLFLLGVGFKFLLHNDSILHLKLGYSHQIFVHIPSAVSIACLSSSKLILSGPFLDQVKALSAFIRSKKIPDVYKGKGIRLEHERINQKEGKNINRS